DQDNIAGSSENFLLHDFHERVFRLAEILRNDDSFTRSQSIRLDDQRITLLAAVFPGGCGFGEGGTGSRRDSGFEKKVFGEGFAGFQAGSGPVRPKGGDTQYL